MRAFAILAAYPAVALAAGSALEDPWTAGVWRLPSDDDYFYTGVDINASGGKFWVHRNVSAYCPDDVDNLDCSAYPGTRTVFTGGNGTLSLAVGVPGGQQVYIAPDSSVSYTTPHSGGMPEGSISTGFTRARSEAFGSPVNLGFTERNWLMCPVTEGDRDTTVFQLFLWSGYRDGCLGTGVRTYTSTSDSWEYV